MPNRPDDPRARQPAQPKRRYARPAPGGANRTHAAGVTAHLRWYQSLRASRRRPSSSSRSVGACETWELGSRITWRPTVRRSSAAHRCGPPGQLHSSIPTSLLIMVCAVVSLIAAGVLRKRSTQDLAAEYHESAVAFLRLHRLTLPPRLGGSLSTSLPSAPKWVRAEPGCGQWEAMLRGVMVNRHVNLHGGLAHVW
jgi:hypothetical protein